MDDEIERAQKRRDADAQRKEMEGGSDLIDDESMKTLREYIGVIEEKETNLREIREMLRAFEPTIGVQLVSEDGKKILATAWVFVALNVLIASYIVKGLLVDPILKTLEATG